MSGFILRRLGEGLLAMLAVALIAFTLFRYVGDPVIHMAGMEATQRDREELREKLGLNDSTVVQFLRFTWNAAHGEFGFSYRAARPVADLIAERLPATLELVFVGAMLALILGVLFGVVTALYPDGWPSRLILSGSLVGVSLPTFVNGILLIYLFAVGLHWLPSFGRGQVVAIGGGWNTGFLTLSGLKSLIMPALTLALFQTTLILRLVRAEMLEVLRADFIRFARARGLSSRSVNFIHALKNALMPVVTIAGLNIGSVIAFSAITETVFQWPGMSLLFIESVRFADIPVMAAYLVLVALVFVTINLVIDLLYFVIDPRLRIRHERMTAHAG
jgi:peptide/nickel transport system permease protein